MFYSPPTFAVFESGGKNVCHLLSDARLQNEKHLFRMINNNSNLISSDDCSGYFRNLCAFLTCIFIIKLLYLMVTKMYMYANANKM